MNATFFPTFQMETVPMEKPSHFKPGEVYQSMRDVNAGTCLARPTGALGRADLANRMPHRHYIRQNNAATDFPY
jgi:hypothetical protein